jgi:hypothetical protein
MPKKFGFTPHFTPSDKKTRRANYVPLPFPSPHHTIPSTLSIAACNRSLSANNAASSGRLSRQKPAGLDQMVAFIFVGMGLDQFEDVEILRSENILLKCFLG